MPLSRLKSAPWLRLKADLMFSKQNPCACLLGMGIFTLYTRDVFSMFGLRFFLTVVSPLFKFALVALEEKQQNLGSYEDFETAVAVKF